VSQRISISGKGKELFFGADDQRTQVNPESSGPNVAATGHAVEEEPRRSGIPAEPANSPPQAPARQPASEQASSPSSQRARSQPQEPRQSPAAGFDGQRRRLRELVFREHPKHGGYRFAQDELDALRDIEYELEVRRGIKVTKNDIVRLSLNHLIEDYRQRPDDSLLVEVFKEEGGRQR